MSEANQRLRAMATRYKPSVNIEQAPKLWLPLSFVVLGWFSLLVDGLLLLANRVPIAQQAWSLTEVVLLIHVFTLGFLTMTMMGLLYQWVPVVFDVTPTPPGWGLLQGLVYVASLLTFLDGWFRGDLGEVVTGGVGLATAIVLFTILVASRLALSSRRADTVTFGVYAALGGLNATWILGLILALGLSGIVTTNPTQWIPQHILTAAVAWVGTLVFSVQLKLGPMFTMASSDDQRGVPVPLILAWLGLLLWWFGPRGSLLPSILFGTAAVGAFWFLRLWQDRGKAPTPDRVLWTAQAGWLLWLAASMSIDWAPAVSGILFATGALVLILGYQSRILPFVIALVVARHLPGPPHKAFFLARALGSPWVPLSALLGSLLTGLSLSVGVASRQSQWVELAGIVLVLTVLFHVGLMLRQVMTGRRQGLNRLPVHSDY